MKFFTNKNVVQKIIIAVIVVILFNFAVPVRSQAGFFADAATDLVIELMHLVTFLGDSVMNMISFAMLGTEFGSLNVEQDDPNLQEGTGSYIDPSNIGGGNVYETEEYKDEDLDGLIFAAWTVPNIIYCPENIFANKIAALDVNFINPNEYNSVNQDFLIANNASKSAAEQLRPTIATWYRSFRNIAVVGLLSVLVYLGIRILIGSTAQDKAKYKERLKDWVVALCLVFIIHFIMSGILIITENITSLFSSATQQNIIVSVDNGVKFKTNLTGYIRFQAQLDDLFASISYTLIYIILVALTAMFTYTYLKRLLYMAFCTMIAPLVALTYPLDKVGDGKAQAFNMWFKEYLMNAIIQPVHLILYSALVSSAMSLAISNPVYAVAAVAFMVPAEKFIKKMFGLDKASTPSGIGSFAAGAVASQGINYLTNKVSGKSSSGGKDSGSSKKEEEETYKRPKTIDRTETLPEASRQQQPEQTREQQSDVPLNTEDLMNELDDDDNSDLIRNRNSSNNNNNSQNRNSNNNSSQNGNPPNFNTNPNASDDDLTEEERRERQQREAQRGINEQQGRVNRDRIPWAEKGGVRGVIGTQKNRVKDHVYSQGGIARMTGGAIVKGARKGVGAIGNAALKGTGAVVTGTFLGATALASGDTKAAASALAAGITAGKKIGGSTSQKIGNATENITWENTKNAVRNSGWFTQEKAVEREQKIYDSRWKHDEKNIEFLRGVGEDPKKFMEHEDTQKLLNNDITDINAVYNARRLIDKEGVSESNVIKAAKYAKKIPKGFEGNDSAQNAFIEGKVKSGEMTEDEARNMVEYIIAIQKDSRRRFI